MPDLDLRALPPELQATLERVWPGNPEAQRRALLGPVREGGWQSAWPDLIWPWVPARRWWRPGEARQWRALFEWHFGSSRRDILDEEKGPRLFDPAQPFFDTAWTRPQVVVRSPAPEAFSDAEYWAIAMQLFGGNLSVAESTVSSWARDLAAKKITKRGWRRDSWWIETLTIERASATGDLGSL
ncbi:MAG TPA: hypothetical protein VIN03_25910 [Roseateles sp.]